MVKNGHIISVKVTTLLQIGNKLITGDFRQIDYKKLKIILK